MPEVLTAFVLMPFAHQLNKRYQAIKAAADAANICAARVDHEHFLLPGIVARIISQIKSANFIIEDMTEPNANVYYEVGQAHARQKLCILLAKSLKKIPFDLKGYRHIVFKSLPDLIEKLTKELIAAKGEIQFAYDPTDDGCQTEVDVAAIKTKQIGKAVSYRIRVKNNSERRFSNVRAHVVKFEKQVNGDNWQEFVPVPVIPLVWANNNSLNIDLEPGDARYLNVLHINRSDDRFGIWQFQMRQELENFLDKNVLVRMEIQVLERDLQVEFIWRQEDYSLRLL